ARDTAPLRSGTIRLEALDLVRARARCVADRQDFHAEFLELRPTFHVALGDGLLRLEVLRRRRKDIVRPCPLYRVHHCVVPVSARLEQLLVPLWSGREPTGTLRRRDQVPAT